MSDKKLNITADLKVRTTDAERTLQKLSKDGVKISQILKGLDITTQGGRAGFAKSLTMASKEMLKLRGTTQDTAKVMEYVYGRTIEKQSKRIDEYTRKIERLNKQFRTHQYNHEFYSSLGNDKMASSALSRSDSTASKIVVAEAAKQALQAALGDLRGPGSPPSRQFDWAAFQQALGFSKMMTGGVASMAGIYQSYKTVGAQNLGHIRDYERGLLGSMAGGDFSDLYFATRKVEGGKNLLRHAIDQYGGTTAGKIQTSAQAVGGMVDVGMGVMQMKGKGGFETGTGPGEPLTTRDISNIQAGASHTISGITGAGQALVNRALGGPEVQEVQSVMAGLHANKLQDPMTQMALQWTTATAGMRVAAAKALQGRHMGAWGVGQGFGLDMGESFGAAQQLARQFGVDAALGRGGGGTTRTDVRMVQGSGVWLSPQDWARNGSMSNNIAMDRARLNREELVRQGYEKFDEVGGNSLFRKQITEGGGGGAEGLLRSVLGLERKGMDRGVAGSALGTMMMATGGNLSQANRQLEDVMTKAFGRGIHDARLGEEIVRATGESAFGAGGKINSMAAFGMALSGGLGSGSTMHDVQSNLGGARAFDSLIKGNSYFSAVQLEAAKRTLGAGATGSQMLAIQRASMADLIGGSQQLGLAGVGSDQRRAILGQTANSLMGTYLTNSMDPATSDLRKALGGSGGDIIKMFQGAGSNKKQLMEQFALALSLNSGMGQDDAMGLARVLSGVDSKADSGSRRRNFADHADGVAESTVRAQQAVLDEFFKKEREIQDEYLKALRAARPLAETIANNDPAFDAFQKFFTQFMEIMQKAMQDPRLRAQLVGGMTQKGQ
jgi:hypothetical protein